METVVKADLDKAILVKDGIETCTIGFLPRHIMARGMMEIERFTGKFAQIIKLLDLCSNSMANNPRVPGIMGWLHFFC